MGLNGSTGNYEENFKPKNVELSVNLKDFRDNLTSYR